MAQEKSILPSVELVRKWRVDYFGDSYKGPLVGVDMYIATQAAQWAADQQLESCCEKLEHANFTNVDWLRTACRPNQQTMKQRALAALSKIQEKESTHIDIDIIYQALQQLPNNQN